MDITYINEFLISSDFPQVKFLLCNTNMLAFHITLFKILKHDATNLFSIIFASFLLLRRYIQYIALAEAFSGTKKIVGKNTPLTEVTNMSAADINGFRRSGKYSANGSFINRGSQRFKFIDGNDREGDDDEIDDDDIEQRIFSLEVVYIWCSWSSFLFLFYFIFNFEL